MNGVKPTRERPVIYQLLPRLFGRSRGGASAALSAAGSGKFVDVDERVLGALRELGVNTLWLTGVLEHATRAALDGLPADDPDIVKGSAGSPYAVRDLFDVAADLALDPARRLDEFRALIERCHRAGLAVWLDFVPNHVARSHHSDVRPDLELGEGDDWRVFFARDNHFYYLQPEHPGGGPPLRLPGAGAPGCDGLFAPETEFGRVTGNNAVTWAPTRDDWYETVKLNFGHDFTHGRDTSHLPGPDAPLDAVPRTWVVLDAALAHWQALGVDGFRADMAHMVPMEFWRWALARARQRDGAVHFCAEAYDNDPAKLTAGHVLDELLAAGFDSVYDDPLYDLLEGLYEGGKWCNDLDALVAPGARFERSLRYGENHDEVRLAHPSTWGGLGMEIGRPVCALLYTLGPGPLMLYMGQEVGEPALEGATREGSARTSIFDYGRCAELARWYHEGLCDGGALDEPRRELRAWYARLLALAQQPLFQRGATLPLNRANIDNPTFGRQHGEPASGHWVYAFLRILGSEAALVVVNFHPNETLVGATVHFTDEARVALAPTLDSRMSDPAGQTVELWDALSESDSMGGEVRNGSFALHEVPRMNARVFLWARREPSGSSQASIRDAR